MDTPLFDPVLVPSVPSPLMPTPEHDVNQQHRRTSGGRDDGAAVPIDSSGDAQGDAWRDTRKEDHDDDKDHMESFHRISGILTSLIQEAHEAIHGNPDKIQAGCIGSKDDVSPSCRRSPSLSSISSSETLIPTSPTVEAVPPPGVVQTTCVSPVTRHKSKMSTTSRHGMRGNDKVVKDQWAVSCQRLDSSLALVDSLSQDLVSPTCVKRTPWSRTPMIAVFLFFCSPLAYALVSSVFLSPWRCLLHIFGTLMWTAFLVMANTAMDRLFFILLRHQGNPKKHACEALPCTFTPTSLSPRGTQAKPRRRCNTTTRPQAQATPCPFPQ